MKLASLGDRSRDGRLVVVSRDLTLCSDARHLAPTLQAALDDWEAVAPELELIARGIEAGGQPVARFHERDALAPLPRAYQRSDPGDRHGARTFGPPRGPALAGPGTAGFGLLATGGGAPGLVVLVVEGREGATLAPVAVTPDELAAPLTLAIDDAPAARLERLPDLAALVAAAAAARPLAPGCIVTGEPIATIAPLRPGGRRRVEVRDERGRTIFGAIDGAEPEGA